MALFPSETNVHPCPPMSSLLFPQKITCFPSEVMSGHGWTWLDMVGHGWTWLDMVGHGWTWVDMREKELFSEGKRRQTRGSLMKTHNWLRPRARLFAVHKVSLRRSAARRACSFPPRCRLLQLRCAANRTISPYPSGQIYCCCSLTLSLAVSSEDLCLGCPDFYQRGATKPSLGTRLSATTRAPTKPPCTEADLSAQGRILSPKAMRPHGSGTSLAARVMPLSKERCVTCPTHSIGK